MSTDARDVRSTSEEGFHEIQLSGKQLVFLFMATTVVSIVIFLCGVLVGRGVRGEASATEAPARGSVAELTPDLGPAAASPKGAAEATPPTDEEQLAPSAGDLTYPERLSGAKAPVDTLRQPAAKSTTTAAAPAEKAPPDRRPASAAAPAATSAAAKPGAPPASAPSAAAAAASGKYTVQVAAYAERSQAADLAKKLSGRGYAAYVEPPATGKGAKMYRVRVGGYAEKREADAMRQKLQKEGKFKPWVTTR